MVIANEPYPGDEALLLAAASYFAEQQPLPANGLKLVRMVRAMQPDERLAVKKEMWCQLQQKGYRRWVLDPADASLEDPELEARLRRLSGEIEALLNTLYMVIAAAPGGC